MIVAAYDFGSNTTLMLVAEIQQGRVTKIFCDESTVTKMGQGVHANRELHPEALQRIDECLNDFDKKLNSIQGINLKDVYKVGVATSAARDVKNPESLYNLAKKYDIDLHVIEGKKEAELTFLGSAQEFLEKDKTCAVIDVGGGSTEIIVGNDQGFTGHSYDVGSVRLSELFITKHPIPEKEVVNCQNYARGIFSEKKPMQKIDVVIGVAGTPTTLAALQSGQAFSEETVHRAKLNLELLNDWIKKLAAMTLEEREHLPGMQPKRGEVIVVGATILREALQSLDQQELIVSTRGVRYGVAAQYERFKKQGK